MREELPEFFRLPEDDAERLNRIAVLAIGFVIVLLFAIVVYAIGEKAAHFSWPNLKRGLLTFGVILLTACGAVILVTVLLRGVTWLVPETMQHLAERRVFRKSRDKALAIIEEKQQLSEERARMTARLQATYLFEKEATQAANARASQEFREALQSSVMRSCEIAFEHITRVVEQYETVVREIESSELPTREKTALLNGLSAQLDVAAHRERSQDAQKMMEGEIWKVRFRKARYLAKSQPEAAVRYLKSIQAETHSRQRRSRISAMIESVVTGSAPTNEAEDENCGDQST